MQLLKGHFRPEFLNRIDEVIVFNSLSQENIRLIVQIQLDRLIRTAAAQDITVKLDDSLVEHLVEVGYQPDFGARELKRKIRQEVETKLAKEILSDQLKSGDTVVSSARAMGRCFAGRLLAADRSCDARQNCRGR